MLTEHEPPNSVQLPPGVKETNPDGTLILPVVVSTIVALHVRVSPTMPVPGHASIVEVGVGETVIVADEIAVCWGELLSVIVSVTLKVPANENAWTAVEPVALESSNAQLKKYGAVPPDHEDVNVACSPTCTEDGAWVKPAVNGGGVTLTDCAELVVWPGEPPSMTVRVTVNDPAEE